LAKQTKEIVLSFLDSMNKNYEQLELRTYVAAKMIGTISITNRVTLGVKAAKCESVSPAYASAPMIPAPPVPDDQVEITFLQ
jgi:hypothetical protein